MAKGDHIYVNCWVSGIPYQHHGIDMGDGTVIHLGPTDGARIAFRDSTDRFSVRRDTLDVFSRGCATSVVQHQNGPGPEVVAEAAESYVGQCGYSLLDGNCEHFACLCASGRSESQQIEMGAATIAALASMSTKAFWTATGRLGAAVAVRGVTRLHPASLLADGVEVAALAVGCRRGLSSDRAKQLARLSGSVAAVGIGAVVAGPAGAAVSLMAHAGSTAIAARMCFLVRRSLS